MQNEPKFIDYFEYMSLQNGGKSVELADRWLLENFLLDPGLDISSMTFRELARVIGKFKTQNAAVPFVDGMELDGYTIKFIDRPSALYFEMQRRCSANISEGLKFGILNCYTANDEPISSVMDKLSFRTAETLSKDMMSFFN